MANRYHINPETGKPGICKAKTPDACKYYNAETQTESPHFDNLEDARIYSYKLAKDENPNHLQGLQKVASVPQPSPGDSVGEYVDTHMVINTKTGKLSDISDLYVADVTEDAMELLTESDLDWNDLVETVYNDTYSSGSYADERLYFSENKNAPIDKQLWGFYQKDGGYVDAIHSKTFKDAVIIPKPTTKEDRELLKNDYKSYTEKYGMGIEIDEDTKDKDFDPILVVNSDTVLDYQDMVDRGNDGYDMSQQKRSSDLEKEFYTE